MPWFLDPEQLLATAEGDRVHAILLEDPDAEAGVLHSITVSAAVDLQRTTLAMLRVPDFSQFEVDTGRRELVFLDQRVVFVPVTDTAVALGGYLGLLERHGIERERAQDAVSSLSYHEGYRDHLDSWTPRERRLALVDELVELADSSPLQRRYLHQGRFQPAKELDGRTLERARALDDAGVRKPRVCHETVLSSLREVDNLDDISYCEGVTLPMYGGPLISMHSWAQISDSPVELTWPWHAPVPPSTAIYYGVSMPASEAVTAVEDRGRYSPLLMNDAEFADISPD